MPLYPSKCYELGSVPRLFPDSSLFRYLVLGLTFESFQELGVRHSTHLRKGGRGLHAPFFVIFVILIFSQNEICQTIKLKER
jgi:hypothetical protein